MARRTGALPHRVPLEELTLPAYPALSESMGPAGQKITRAQLCAGTKPSFEPSGASGTGSRQQRVCDTVFVAPLPQIGQWMVSQKDLEFTSINLQSSVAANT